MVRYRDMVKRAPKPLLESCLEYVLDNGLHGLSLRPLGAAVGVSDRMLMYHFGSKDGLVRQIVESANERLMLHVGQFRSEGNAQTATAVRRAWSFLTGTEGSRISVLYLELCSLSTRDPVRWAPAFRQLRASWTASLGPNELGDAMHTLIVDAVDGLLLDRLTTGDAERVDAALDALLALLENGSTAPEPTS